MPKFDLFIWMVYIMSPDKSDGWFLIAFIAVFKVTGRSCRKLWYLPAAWGSAHLLFRSFFGTWWFTRLAKDKTAAQQILQTSVDVFWHRQVANIILETCELSLELLELLGFPKNVR